MKCCHSIFLIVSVLVGASLATARTIVYIANADSREIFVLELNQDDGSIKVVQRIATSGMVMPLAISPDKKHLFASLRSEPFSVSSFAIDAGSGKLSAIKTVPLADNMANLATDRTGRYLLAASYFGSKISINKIAETGAVDPEPLEVLTSGKNAHCVQTDPSNRFLFVTCLGDDLIMQFHFDEGAVKITPNEPPTVSTNHGAGPRHFVFHPSGKFLFCVNELGGTLDVYQLSGTGTLKRLDTYSVRPPDLTEKPAAADIHVTPDGNFLYASERTSSTIAAFRVNRQSGSLTPIASYPTEKQPRAFNIDPEGRYLLAVGQKSNRLSPYAIDGNNGTLRPLSRLDVGKNPNWVEIISLPK